MAFVSFPHDFTWGAITSSYQIEGAWNEDGKGPSIWDTFVRQPGRIERGETGDVACDHYHRWQDDINLMVDLRLNAYCFSISWPRIFPAGRGMLNQAGLDFYSRLVDGLLDKNIQPYVMLYHWELPQALQDEGGWTSRRTAQDFADYAQVVGKSLGDRVKYWVTHNEPMVAALAGHFTGEHAPGLQDPFSTVNAVHHLLLSHGLAAQSLRAVLPSSARLGIILNLTPCYAASDQEIDYQAARRYDGISNRLFLDPLFTADYPADLLKLLEPLSLPIQSNDLSIISTPLDFLGVNYYSRAVVRHEPEEFPLMAATVNPPDSEYSQMWEIYPSGLYDILMRVQKDYHPAAMYMSENGVCVPDGIDFDGRVRDIRRIRFLRDHLIQLHGALEAGVPLKGYFHWSLMDNFEWALGYRMRFGLVYTDYETQRRIIKDSGRWYANMIQHNGFNPKPVR